MQLYAWWNGMTRQKRTGWTLVIVAVIYLVYFLKARLFETGPEITRKEWFYCIAMLVLIMLGTINIRMAEMKERNQKTMPLVDASRRSKQ
jgi:cbb3-type cytochrome oxidase subunit 1